jgi:hypothetical protein
MKMCRNRWFLALGLLLALAGFSWLAPTRAISQILDSNGDDRVYLMVGCGLASLTFLLCLVLMWVPQRQVKSGRRDVLKRM